MDPQSAISQKRKPLVIIRADQQQAKVLKDAFKVTPLPQPEALANLSKTTGLTEKWIASWFCRQRARARKTPADGATSSDGPSIDEIHVQTADVPIGGSSDSTETTHPPAKRVYRKRGRPKVYDTPIKNEPLEVVFPQAFPVTHENVQLPPLDESFPRSFQHRREGMAFTTFKAPYQPPNIAPRLTLSSQYDLEPSVQPTELGQTKNTGPPIGGVSHGHFAKLNWPLRSIFPGGGGSSGPTFITGDRPALALRTNTHTTTLPHAAPDFHQDFAFQTNHSAVSQAIDAGTPSWNSGADIPRSVDKHAGNVHDDNNDTSYADFCHYTHPLDPFEAPLKHLAVLEPYPIRQGADGLYAEIDQGKIFNTLLEDDSLVDRDPFQAAMGLVFLSQLGLVWDSR